MRIAITVAGYRPFALDRRVSFELQDGLTAFVGPNNAGKSSILRLFHELREPFKNLLTSFDSSWDNENGVSIGEESFHQGDRLEMQLSISADASSKREPNRLDMVLRFADNRRTMSVQLFRRDEPVRKSDWRVNGTNLLPKDSRNEPHIPIPPLQAIEELSDCLSIGPFRHAMDGPGVKNYLDLQTGSEFIQFWSELTAGESGTNRRLLDRVGDQIARIFDLKRLQLIPGRNTIMVNLDGNKSLRLSDLGSGFSQFVQVLTLAAFRRPSYILIDEPELHLHPALQVKFISALSEYAKRGVIYSTHTMGLAREAHRVYVVAPNKDGSPTVRPLNAAARLPELLGELSYYGYRELGCDTILLVEGSHDVKTFREWIAQRGKDRQVVVLQMGGSNLINGNREDELAELLRLTDRVFIVIDSERTSAGASLAKDRRAFVETCEKLKISLCVLDRRATENYMTTKAASAALNKPTEELGHFGALKGWGKSDNWRIASRMQPADLDGADLGPFLDSMFPK
jgi:energy-coupling factor transporter ATP-binding protein EcfA2